MDCMFFACHLRYQTGLLVRSGSTTSCQDPCPGKVSYGESAYAKGG